MTQESEPRSALIWLIAVLAVLLVVMFAFAMGKVTHMLDPLVARRGVGTMLGLMLAAAGNYVPKLRLFQYESRATRGNAIDRFAGGTFVACGLAFALVFLAAPADLVFILPLPIVLAGLLAILLRALASKGRPSAGAPRQLTTGRLLMGAVVVTVAWASAIFLADAYWGDSVSKAMAWWYSVAMILFSVVLAARGRRAIKR